MCASGADLPSRSKERLVMGAGMFLMLSYLMWNTYEDADSNIVAIGNHAKMHNASASDAGLEHFVEEEEGRGNATTTAGRLHSLTQELMSQPAKVEKHNMGWVKAMFDSMDEDKDGVITVNELHQFARTMQMPDSYFDDFARLTNKRGSDTVNFQDFITTIRAREMALNKACQPFETERDQNVLFEAYNRGQWLLGLMAVQSLSGFILQHFEALISNHMVVTIFLTMLVGAGGNAGNQSTIKIIEGLASGEFRPSWRSFVGNMWNQMLVGLVLAMIMCVAGFVRVMLTNGLTRITNPKGETLGYELTGSGLRNCVAISSSLFMIVFISCLMGTFLPFAFLAIKIDAANAGPTLQVLMDIIGVVITCVVCTVALNDDYRATLAHLGLASSRDNEPPVAAVHKMHKSDLEFAGIAAADDDAVTAM